MESGFDQTRKNDRNLRENVKAKVRVVAAAPCLGPFSMTFPSPHASSNYLSC